MRNIFRDIKIRKELKEFRKFKDNYQFKMLELDEKEDGGIFLGNICLRENKDSEWLGECEDFVNVGYKIHGAKPKVLSNLFPYKFYFKGFWLESIESVFQSFKFKDKTMQRLLFSYNGLNSNNIKAASDYDWKKSGIIYFQGKKIDRFSKEIENFIDELYISALQNPLYRNVIRNTGDKYILHAMGEKDNHLTGFTRYEFEKELNTLKDFVLSKDEQC